MYPSGCQGGSRRLPRLGLELQDAVNVNSVGLDYFSALGIALLAGRNFDARDTPESPRVAIVSESFLQQYVPAGRAIGQRFEFQAAPGWPGRV